MKLVLKERVSKTISSLFESYTTFSRVNKIRYNTIYIDCTFTSRIRRNTKYTAQNIYVNDFDYIQRDQLIEKFDGGIKIKNQHSTTLAVIIKEREAIILNKYLIYFYNKQQGIKLFFEKFEDIIENMIVTNPVLLGTDPEFEQNRGARKYKPVRTSVKYSTKAPIGRDGSGNQIELRPGIGQDENDITEKLRSLILRCPHMGVIGDKYPLGFHIHFGLNPKLRRSSNYEAISYAMDYFLGSLLINTSGYARSGYKMLTAYEGKSYGFEYRSLPSSILISPELTRIVFKVARNVALYMIHNALDIDENSKATKDEYMIIAGLTEEEYELLTRFPRWWSENRMKNPVINYIWIYNDDVYARDVKKKINNVVLV